MNDEEKDAFLARAARAYSERHDGASGDAADTRARILAAHERSGRRSWLAIAAAVLLAVCVGVPTAWAWTTGRLEALLRGEERAAPEPEAPEAPPPERHLAPRVRGAVEPVEDVTEDVATEEVVTEEAVAEESVETPAVAEVTDREAVSPQPSAQTERPHVEVDPAERRAYRAAHTLHFDSRDPAGALGAWDRYLAAYPSGRFAIEARYNRALCLVRLDRADEARAALAPFAEGRHGEYRQREARALIEALSE